MSKEKATNVVKWALEGKRVLITGAGGGIGRALADSFANAGSTVFGMEKHEPSEPPKNWQFIQGDVTSEEDTQNAFNLATEFAGGLDAVIANAGVRGITAPIEDWALSDWNDVLLPNLTGVFLTAREAVRSFRRAGGGKLILMSSGAGRKGYPKRSGYATSKWGVIGLAKTIAAEQGPNGITANAILPGLVRSPGASDMLEKRAVAENRTYMDVEKEFLSRTPLGSWTDIEDIVNASQYLISSAGDRVSGLTFSVDAGRSAMG